MDRPLSADRRDYNSDRREGYFRTGGGGSRGRGRGRGRGGYYGGSRRDNNNNSSNHHPYHNNNNNRGGGRLPPRGNRFQAEQQHPYDPRQSTVQQLLQLLNQVGALNAAPELPDNNTGSQRGVVAAQAKNIQAMTDVLCGSKADIFLQYDDHHHDSNNLSTITTPVPNADKMAGPFAAGLVHCQAVWPCQTAGYAALTLAVAEHAAVKTAHLAGVAERCLEYTSKLLGRDLDLLLLEQVPASSSSSSDSSSPTDRPRAMVRLRLTLRYLAMLTSAGVVQCAAKNDSSFGLVDLLRTMVQAATHAEQQHNNRAVACVLAALVLSTIPYVRNLVPAEWISDTLVAPLQDIILDNSSSSSYQSSFAPGVGAMSILLKAERHEDMGDDLDEEEDDEDDDEAQNQVCDTLQDLLRSVKQFLKDGDSAPCRFALFTDAPWNCLKAPVVAGTENGGAESMAAPLVFSGAPIHLNMLRHCRSLMLLQGGKVPASMELARINLNGIVFGRLPFFGPPPEATDDEEDEEQGGLVNERYQAYRTGFKMVDRFFLGEAVRDCIISHEGRVTETGVQHGSIKAVAEQIWSLRHVIAGETTNGVEYCILETILSLIAQCERGSPLRLVYLSRVLLELTRLEPSIISPAIALGVSTLFQDYMPALVPIAGYNLSRWFAFHLINTDYQWPAAYWKHWEPFVLYGWANSRGAFVKGALAIMVENLSNPELLATECLPKESAIVEHLLSTPMEPLDDGAILSLSDEVQHRIWENSEGSDSLLAHLVSDEIGESIAGALNGTINRCGRTIALARAIMSPALLAYKATKEAISNIRSGDDLSPMDEAGDTKDVLSVLQEKIEEYKNALQGVMVKDVNVTGYESDGKSHAEVCLLGQVASATSYSRTILEGCVQALLQQELVHVSSVLKWSLGETTEGSSTGPVLRWWEIVSSSIQLGISKSLAEEHGTGAMGDENEDDMITTKQARILDYLDPLLSYVIQRVSSLLVASTNGKANKLSSEQVDLTEGFKYVTLDCHNIYYAIMQKEGQEGGFVSSADLHESLSESAIAGSKLASLLDGDGSLGADMLRQSLERL
jgi:hypothetical protein